MCKWNSSAGSWKGIMQMINYMKKLSQLLKFQLILSN